MHVQHCPAPAPGERTTGLRPPREPVGDRGRGCGSGGVEVGGGVEPAKARHQDMQPAAAGRAGELLGDELRQVRGERVRGSGASLKE